MRIAKHYEIVTSYCTTVKIYQSNDHVPSFLIYMIIENNANSRFVNGDLCRNRVKSLRCMIYAAHNVLQDTVPFYRQKLITKQLNLLTKCHEVMRNDCITLPMQLELLVTIK